MGQTERGLVNLVVGFEKILNDLGLSVKMGREDHDMIRRERAFLEERYCLGLRM